LLPIPLAWGLYSALTLYTMGQDALALIPLSQALIAFALCILRWRDRRRRR
jgi:hypothetical protein